MHVLTAVAPKLKELEKMGPKMKGIGAYQHLYCTLVHKPNPRTSVSQSVKEVLQSLVDDGLVQMDKIGSSNCEQRLSVEGYD